MSAPSQSLSVSVLAFAGTVITALPATASETISAQCIFELIKVLSSDEFEGRGPGSSGEEKTETYLFE